MDKIRLINDDAVRSMKKMKNNSINLIIADPPYNLSKDYKATNDNMDFNHFIRFTKDWLSEGTRILKPGGTLYVFMGMRLISYLYEIMEQDCNLDFENWITWHYTQGLGKKKSYSSRHDDILMFSKPGAKKTFNLDSIRVPQKYYRSINNMRGANPGNVWNLSHVHYSQGNRQKHPTQKPEGVIERMVLASSNIGDTVLDPFSGSGTTMRVVQQTNREGIGIEIEPSFVEDTKIRLREPFLGFDSIDERMYRIPKDLNKESVRRDYFQNHIKWFFNNHEISLKDYFVDFKSKYGSKMTNSEINEFNITARKFGINVRIKYSELTLF